MPRVKMHSLLYYVMRGWLLYYDDRECTCLTLREPESDVHPHSQLHSLPPVMIFNVSTGVITLGRSSVSFTAMSSSPGTCFRPLLVGSVLLSVDLVGTTAMSGQPFLVWSRPASCLETTRKEILDCTDRILHDDVRLAGLVEERGPTVPWASLLCSSLRCSPDSQRSSTRSKSNRAPLCTVSGPIPVHIATEHIVMTARVPPEESCK